MGLTSRELVDERQRLRIGGRHVADGDEEEESGEWRVGARTAGGWANEVVKLG